MRILFVCLGNICRSPTAEGVLRKFLQQADLSELITVDSAGTAAWHIGKAPDLRTQRAAATRGYDLSAKRARQFCAEDFDCFDLILAMDENNLRDIEKLRPAGNSTPVDLLLRRYESTIDEVPDPYYGGAEGFEQVLDLLEDASQKLLNEARSQL